MTLNGIFTPIPTPFLTDGQLDERALRANVERWMRTPLAGLVVLGSNGEAVLLEDDEADRAIALVRDGVPRERVLIAGTGRESTAATIDATTRAVRAGVDAVLVRTPSFFKAQMTTDAFVAHYRAVAEASPVPVLLYNVTMYTGVNMLPDAAARLAEHPNIVGIKESGNDIAQIAEFVNRTPARFSVLAGSAVTFYASLSVGVTGAVLALAAVVPEQCVRLYDLVQGGRHAEAAALQHQLVPLARSVGSVHGVPGLKAALDLIGYAGGPPRPPLLPAPPAAVATIREQLNALQAITAG